jgi:hypothetical protein
MKHSKTKKGRGKTNVKKGAEGGRGGSSLIKLIMKKLSKYENKKETTRWQRYIDCIPKTVYIYIYIYIYSYINQVI